VQGFKFEPGFLISVFVGLAEQSKHLDDYSKLQFQVVIVTSIMKNWFQPIYYSFDQNTTFNILKKAIDKVQKSGFEVCCVMSDMGGSNQGFLRSMNVSYENPIISYPCNNEKRIHFFADMPHLIELLKNRLLDQGIYLSENRVTNS